MTGFALEGRVAFDKSEGPVKNKLSRATDIVLGLSFSPKMNQLTEQSRKAIKAAVELLVGERYQELEELTGAQRLTANMMRTVITQYGCKLRLPDNYDLVDVVPVAKGELEGWSVWVPLYTVEEGRSDLTMLLQISQTESGETVLRLDDIRVL